MDYKSAGVVLGGVGIVASLAYLGTQTKQGRAYLQHSALNLGQAARDVRYFYEHPDADKVAKPGTAMHVLSSATSRVPSLASNLYYAALPPQLHHSEEELYGEMGGEMNLRRSFMEGYDPWEYKRG